jgi:hypothetical protein
MTTQMGTTLRDAILDAIETTVGTAPVLEIRTGAQPANCAAADSGTLLVSITAPSDWAGASSSGTKAKAGTWSGTAVGTGTAAHYRFKTSIGTVSVQGSVTATGGGGDLTLDNASIATDQTVTINTFSFTNAQG